MSHESLWKKCLEYCSISDMGLRRSNNQDSHSETVARDQKQWNRRGHLFIVADGMGAHAAGELASKLATDLVPISYFKKTGMPPAEALRAAIQEANEWIHARGNADSGHKGMGTTCDALLILPEGAVIAHVGDSRVYRLRAGRFEQMTFDHSVAWETEAGLMKPDVPVQKNVITRCLGVNVSVDVALEGPWELRPGDIFLLCSDGLSGQFEKKDAEMGKILSALPLPEATQVLVDLANLRGGPDNITVTTVKYLGPQQVAADVSAAEPVSKTLIDFRPVPAWAWSTLGILGLLTFLCLILTFRSWLFGAGALLSLLAAGILAAAVCRMRQPPPAFPGTGRLGRGPYRAYHAECDAEMVKTLRGIYEELRASTAGQENSGNFQSADRMAQKGEKAAAGGNYTQGCAEFCRAISAVWRCLGSG